MHEPTINNVFHHPFSFYICCYCFILFYACLFCIDTFGNGLSAYTICCQLVGLYIKTVNRLTQLEKNSPSFLKNSYNSIT